MLKKIAKACGVTQSSLLNAAKEPAKKTTAKKIVSAKKSTADKDEEKKSTAKKTSAATGSTMKLTAAEKKLVQLYRDADSDTKKEVLKLLSPEEESDDNPLLDVLGDILGGLLK